MKFDRKSVRSGLIALFGVVSLCLGLGSPGGAQSRGDLRIVARGMTRNYDVRGKRIIVRGNNNHIVWRGDSPLLRVTGNNNRIEADAVRVIIITGRNNSVEWKRPYNGVAPRVSRKGGGNSVFFSGKSVTRRR